MTKICTRVVFAVAVILLIASSMLCVSAKDEISVVLDGQQLQFDVQPIIENGRTLVPMRKIFESLGATVDWDGTTKTVTSTRGTTTIKMTIGSKTMLVNGNKVTLDTPAKVIEKNGVWSTIVPVRAISESFGCQVGWDGKTRIVSIINDSKNYTMLYATGDRSRAFVNNDVNAYLQVGWFRDKELKDNTIQYTKKEIFQQFIDFVKTNGSYNEGKYGIQAAIPYYTSDKGVTYGSVTLLYVPKSDQLEIQVFEVYESNRDSATTIQFLSLEIPEIADTYKWQFQYSIDYPSYSRYSDYFMASEGTLKANVDSYLDDNSVEMSEVIYGFEITSGSSEMNVGTLMIWVSAYGNKMFTDNNSTLSFADLGID